MSAGRLLYLFFHQPRAWLEERIDNRLRTGRDARMREHALRLKPLEVADWGLALPPLRFLTGAGFAHQTAFCAQSLTWASGTHLRTEFYSDGSLRALDRDNLLRLFPHGRIIDVPEAEGRLETHLPVNTYPHLRAMRAYSPFMRKLLDLHVGLNGPSLYLDSDMLFFHRPQSLLAWLADPRGGRYMQETRSGYVGDPAVLEAQLGQPLARCANAGLVGLNDSEIPWDLTEEIAGRMTEAQRRHMWAEQTITAFILRRLGAQPLDPSDYRLCSNRAESAIDSTLKHYVFKAKAPYLKDEWLRLERLINLGEAT